MIVERFLGARRAPCTTAEHKLVEKYVVEGATGSAGGGEYPLQDGFGWTNGVTLQMLDLAYRGIPPPSRPADPLAPCAVAAQAQ